MIKLKCVKNKGILFTSSELIVGKSYSGTIIHHGGGYVGISDCDYRILLYINNGWESYPIDWFIPIE